MTQGERDLGRNDPFPSPLCNYETIVFKAFLSCTCSVFDIYGSKTLVYAKYAYAGQLETYIQLLRLTLGLKLTVPFLENIILINCAPPPSGLPQSVLFWVSLAGKNLFLLKENLLQERLPFLKCPLPHLSLSLFLFNLRFSKNI